MLDKIEADRLVVLKRSGRVARVETRNTDGSVESSDAVMPGDTISVAYYSRNLTFAVEESSVKLMYEIPTEQSQEAVEP